MMTDRMGVSTFVLSSRPPSPTSTISENPSSIMAFLMAAMVIFSPNCPSVAGAHMGGEDEIISLKHSAHSKKIFAVGAIKAAKWLLNKEPGYYDMEDVLFGK